MPKLRNAAPVAPGSPVTVIKSAHERRELVNACTEYRENNDLINTLKKQNEALMAGVIRPTLDRLETNKVLGEGWQAIRVTRTTKKIVPSRLLEQGVTLAQIEQATEVTDSTSYQIRKLGDDSGEE